MRFFTTLDLAKGLHQISVDKNSIEKTAFAEKNGTFEYLRMPFGLKNATATFQRMLDTNLMKFLHTFCFRNLFLTRFENIT